MNLIIFYILIFSGNLPIFIVTKSVAIAYTVLYASGLIGFLFYDKLVEEKHMLAFYSCILITLTLISLRLIWVNDTIFNFKNNIFNH